MPEDRPPEDRFEPDSLESPDGYRDPRKPEDLIRLLESFRHYLLVIAERELPEDLRAKGGASDLVQEAFLIAHRKIGDFRGGSELELRAWLRQILLHRMSTFARTYRKTSIRQVTREVSIDGDPAVAIHLVSDTTSPSQGVIRKEQQTALFEAIAQLSERDHALITLRQRERLSFDEIGNQLGISAVAARKAWLRAIERLRERLRASERKKHEDVD